MASPDEVCGKQHSGNRPGKRRLAQSWVPVVGLVFLCLGTPRSATAAQGQLGNFWQASTDYFHVFDVTTNSFVPNPTAGPAQDYNILLDPNATITIYDGVNGSQGSPHTYNIVNVFGFAQVYNPVTGGLTVSDTAYADSWAGGSSWAGGIGAGDTDNNKKNALLPGIPLKNTNLGTGSDLADFNFGTSYSSLSPPTLYAGSMYWGAHITIDSPNGSPFNSNTGFVYFNSLKPGSPPPAPVPEPAFVQFGTLAALAAAGAGYRWLRRVATA